MTETVPPQSGLEMSLRAGAFVLTAEVVPPSSCRADDLVAKALPLRGLADAVNVTDGAGARAHMGATAAAAILARNGIEPILQLACRDRNRIALQGELMGAAALGIRNLLLLRGDDPTAGDQKDAKPVFDLDSRALIETARAMRDRGALPHGPSVAGAPRFFIGGADVPIDPPPGWLPTALAGKVESGAQFVQTQFCMDVGVVRRYIERLQSAGLIDKLSLLIGVCPLRSARSAHWMRHHLPGTVIPEEIVGRLEAATDPAAEGATICIELVTALAQIPGVAGAHIMAPGNDAVVPQVLKSLRSRLPAARQSSLGGKESRPLR